MLAIEPGWVARLVKLVKLKLKSYGSMLTCYQNPEDTVAPIGVFPCHHSILLPKPCVLASLNPHIVCLIARASGKSAEPWAP